MKLPVFLHQLDAFWSHQTLFDKIILIIGTVILPGYFITNKLAILFLLIEKLSNNQPINFFSFLSIIIQTAIIVYSITLFLLKFEVKPTAKSEYKGVHHSLNFSYIPQYLISPSISNVADEEVSHIEIPGVDEIIKQDEKLSENIPSLEELLKFYDTIQEEDKINNALNTQPSEQKVKNMLDVLVENNVSIDQLMEEI